ncbi:MAG: hypothetical protein UV74_C0013G0368 [Candidatus Woesebacteria bacterium GW2011_GWB1_43_14]|uniref:Glycosyltransferase RgtA/B/C/D-like domain-containing protein n=1 Tax=Candidatus Woesebacteria bacterium GW2011_GWB1_43_14 TaxID=1618578 RepID=A0A0G1FQE3_9BACT|nr:MAG: hypothetical protein UT21_C0001G0078 [Candidatus Woesebacteria bacterium GW2011_GWA1_39_11b]KKS78336.1 MAG: hypothetical protein UV51_C0001G0052 [Candidatus Woesebacteria bacterium GW2011_GWC1_42_9]KKS97246.1 MAG: hypothetical protein UV74_C0013G0368 [Candidatus Woesebacteria bacterium GW2011_GWB1_43_14]
MRITNNVRHLLLFFVLCPGFWWGIINSTNVFREIGKSPHYFQGKLGSIYSYERTERIKATKNANVDLGLPGRLVGGFFFNEFTIVVDEFFDLTSFLSPRFFFQAGDGSLMSPPRTEPIPLVLFPAWVLGIITIVRKKNFGLLKILIILVFIPYILGQKNLVFLWPVMILYIFIAREGIMNIGNIKTKNNYLHLFVVYGVFVVLRSFYLLLR